MKMNTFVLIVMITFIVSIYANFNITEQNPNTTTLITINEFKITIDKYVNQPVFQCYIRIFEGITNASICTIDVHTNNISVKYFNKTLVFNTSSCANWSKSAEYYITFDEGVLFSNATWNSTAQTSPIFWYLKVAEINTKQSSDTATDATSASSMIATVITTQPSSSGTDSNVPVTTNSNTTTTTTTTIPRRIINGEPPPTRSAQLGMGLGIMFISILLIGEIIYFKCFYHGGRRGGSYLA